MEDELGLVFACLVATEDKVIYWGNPTGLEVEKDWEVLSIAQTVNLIKATYTPFHLMKLVDADTIRASAQELDRVYIRTVRVNFGLMSEGAFNLSQKQATTVEDRIIKEALIFIQNSGENMLIKDLEKLLIIIFTRISKEPLGTQNRNKIINNMIAFTDLIYAKGAHRTRVNGVLTTVIKHKRLTGAKSYNNESLEEAAQEILSRAKALN